MSGKNFHKLDSVATAATIATLICWSMGPVFIRYIAGFLDSWSQNLFRYAAACLFWLPYLLIARENNRADSRVWRKAILPSVMNIVMQSFWAMSIYYIEPAFMNLLTKSYIVWIAGFSLAFFADERGLLRSKRFWCGLILCLSGLAGITIFKKDFTAAGTLTGIILALSAGASWAMYTITVRVAFKDIDSRTGFSVISIYSLAGLGLLAVLFGRPSACIDLDLRIWSFIIVSGVVCIALGHVLYYIAIKRIGATIPSLVLLFTPFFVLAVSWVVFGETLNLPQWVCGLVLAAGSGLAIWAQQHLRAD